MKMEKERKNIARKKIIFCLGDKNELEEITGEKYEYLRDGLFDEKLVYGRKIKEHVIGSTPKGTATKNNLYEAFIEVTAETEDNVQAEFFDLTKWHKCDAIIHYTVRSRVDDDKKGTKILYVARGTPVRKWQKK